MGARMRYVQPYALTVHPACINCLNDQRKQSPLGYKCMLIHGKRTTTDDFVGPSWTLSSSGVVTLTHVTIATQYHTSHISLGREKIYIINVCKCIMYSCTCT